MSSHNVNNFVSDLVMMAQAMERVPQLEKEITRQENVIIDKDNIIAMIQLDLEQARSYSAKLEAKVHDLEVAKDQAETMFLEADDRFNRTLDFVKTAFGSAGALIQAVEPVKVEAKPEPIAPIAHSEPDTTQGQSEPDPTSSALPGVIATIEPVTALDTAPLPPDLDTSWASPAEPNASTPSADGPGDAKSSIDEPRYFDYDGGNHFYRG